MKKVLTILVILFALWQFATAQPTGPEVKWVINVESSDAKFTQDDKYIVAIDGGDIIVIDAENGKILRRNLVSPNFIRRQVKLSKDDSLIYTCGDDGIIYINRFSDLQIVKEFRKVVDLYAQAPIESFDISFKNNIMILSFGNPNMIFYDMTKDSILNTITTGYYCRNIKFFDNDNKFIVSYGGNIKIYDTKTMQKIVETYPHAMNNWVTSLDISPDNTKIVDCGNDGKVYICDVNTGTKLEEIPYSTGDPNINAVKYYKNGTNIIIGGDGDPNKISIFDLNTKKIFYKNPGVATIINIELSKLNTDFLTIGGSYSLFDGNLITSVVSGNQGKDRIIILPNPIDSIILIELVNNKIKGQINFIISDIQGKIVKSGIIKSYTKNIQLDVSSLQNGVYFLILNTGNSSETYKFIKVR
ncbi:MAG: T9SS type A sorting domain-containing protein [FCB group bacterium]